MTDSNAFVWHKVLDADGLDEGRVISVAASTTGIALCHFNGQYDAVERPLRSWLMPYFSKRLLP